MVGKWLATLPTTFQPIIYEGSSRFLRLGWQVGTLARVRLAWLAIRFPTSKDLYIYNIQSFRAVSHFALSFSPRQRANLPTKTQKTR